MTEQKKVAPGGGDSQYYTDHQYNTDLANRKPADFEIAAAITDQRAADRLVSKLRGNIVLPDLLFTCLREMGDDAARLRGFCRAVQKSLERGGGL